MLVRNQPFKEWVTVYYDPARITEAKLLNLLRQNRCPRAALDRIPGAKLTAMNPYVGPGGIVQFRIATPPAGHQLGFNLPDDWNIVGPQKGVVGEDGKTYVSVQVPAGAKPGNYTLGVDVAKRETALTTVGVVRRIGR